MTNDDVMYVEKVLSEGLVQSPCLELGVGYEEGFILKNLLLKSKMDYVGTDMVTSPAVDYVVDFEEEFSQVQQKLPQAGEFGTAFVLNVLEHTFEPVKVLDNVMNTLRPGGTCVVVTPAVWTLHSYPYDCCRLLPNFYEEYCKRRSLELITDSFEYVGGKGTVHENQDANGYRFPKPGANQFQYWVSKTIHKLFNTTGRDMFFTSHIAVGAVIRKPLESPSA
jgi:SAM-dependent methyltransferase